MPDAGGRRADQVGVLIGRTEPRALALVRGTGASGLSPQQREVALLLADGKSNQEIARALSLKLNTASYHVKQVFTRLKVHNRKEVERELLKLAHEGTLRRARDDERSDAAGSRIAKAQASSLVGRPPESPLNRWVRRLTLPETPL